MQHACVARLQLFFFVRIACATRFQWILTPCMRGILFSLLSTNNATSPQYQPQPRGRFAF